MTKRNIAILIAITMMYSCSFSDGKNMNRTQLFKHYIKHEKDFNDLGNYLLQKKGIGLKRIDDSWTDPKKLTEIGINNYELNLLRNKLAKLSCPRGVSLYRDGVEFIIYSVGIVGSGGSKGLYFSEKEPTNYWHDKPDLQTKPFSISDILPERFGSKYSLYIKISGKWYIHEEFD